MKYIIAIILLLNSAKAQEYIANWTTVPKEIGVVNYQVEKSSNNITWVTIATVTPKRNMEDSNYYAVILPAEDNYIRIKSVMITDSVTTASIKIVNENVTISNLLLEEKNSNFDKLSFTANNEWAVSYYSIHRLNSNSTEWAIAGKLFQTNKKNYVVNIFKNGNDRKYRLSAVYKNGIKSDYINF